MKSRDVLRILNISRATLTNLVKSGKIRVITLPNGYYDYNSDDVYSYLGKSQDKLNVIYARVSNIKLKKNLENQISEITNFCQENNYKVDYTFHEIAPGIDMNNRPELFKLLSLVLDNQVSKVFVYSRDRFGKSCYGLFRQLLIKYGTEIVAINEGSDWKLDNNEMFDEMTFLLSRFSNWQSSGKNLKKAEIKPVNNLKKILVVDDSKVTLALIEKNLSKKDYIVVTTNSAVEGAELLKKDSYSLVITDINMPEINGLDFLLWIRKFRPNVKVIMITAYSSDETRSFVNQNGAVHYFEKPLNFEKLDKFIKYVLDKKGFAGSVKDINLFDLMQMIILSGKEKLISVIDPLSNNEGLIYFQYGNIIHAEYNKLYGEPAFYAMMKIIKGDFYDKEWIEPKEKTIHLPYDFLIINSKKLVEEKNIQKSKIKDTEQNIGFNNFENSKNKRILIVDDSLVALKIMENYLTSKGFSVTSTNSASQGLELLKKEFFYLVITDLYMPEINGIEFLLWVKNNSPHSRVIMVTGFGSDEIKTYISKNGAISYFEKPVNFQELEIFIKRLFAEKDFSGNIKDISLIEFIQVITLSRKNKLISVIDPIKNIMGLIYIRDGEVIHAKYGSFSGEEAFHELVSIENGIFSHMPWNGDSEITIDIPLHDLLQKQTEFKLLPMVKASPKFIEKALAQKEALEEINLDSNQEKSLTVYESGVIMGIIPGKNKKSEIIEIMKQYSKSENTNLNNKVFSYPDLDIDIIFDQTDTVDEIHFGKNFKGITSSGITIGYNSEKAAQIYGRLSPPLSEGFVWENLLFLNDEKENIRSFRLKSRNYLENNSGITENYLLSKIIEDEFFQNITIDESGEFLGILIGKSTINETKEIMKRYSKGFNETESTNIKLVYSDLSLNILLIDGVVEELNFGSSFKGITRKGIKIGDHLDKAIEIYGVPRFNNEKCGVWDKISFFCEEPYIIGSINIGSI